MPAEPTRHVPVMLAEALAWLTPQPGATIVDGTVGGGGHAVEFARRVAPGGKVIGIDRDIEAIERAAKVVGDLPIELMAARYSNLPEVLEEFGIDAVDAVLLDLGLSSDQLADEQRGFSFHSIGPLDLRFDTSRGDPAWMLVDRLDQRTLADLIFNFGEERFSRRIARKIVAQRQKQPIRTAAELAAVVRSCVPRSRGHSIDPATRTFQALRIAVNDELQELERGLERIPACLKPSGRLAIMSFHSLEDRRVKHGFRNDKRLEVLTPKPIVPTVDEQQRNPRAASAKLRVAARIP